MSEEFTPFSTQQDGMDEKIYRGEGGVLWCALGFFYSSYPKSLIKPFLECGGTKFHPGQGI